MKGEIANLSERIIFAIRDDPSSMDGKPGAGTGTRGHNSHCFDAPYRNTNVLDFVNLCKTRRTLQHSILTRSGHSRAILGAWATTSSVQ